MWLIALGLIIVLQSFIDLEVHIPTPLKSFNIPISDALMCLLLPFVLIRKDWRTLLRPELLGFVIIILALLLGTLFSLQPAESLYTWFRKPVFMGVAYGVGLTWALKNRCPKPWFSRIILIWQVLVGGILILNGLSRFATGDGLWWQAISGLTPNHKALAVSLSSILPLLWVNPKPHIMALKSAQKERLFWAIQGLVILALIISFSKTAWLIMAFSVGWFLPKNKPISQRPIRIALLGLLAMCIMINLPYWLDSRVMMDALRSRHSINLRVMEMFFAHPLTGMGTATNLHYEMVTFPHYRINGVDAHGSLQKLASEGGIFALLGFGVFFWGGRKERLQNNPQVMVAYWSLFLSSLLSTEILHSTWWIPYALVMTAPRDQSVIKDSFDQS